MSDDADAPGAPQPRIMPRALVDGAPVERAALYHAETVHAALPDGSAADSAELAAGDAVRYEPAARTSAPPAEPARSKSKETPAAPVTA